MLEENTPSRHMDKTRVISFFIISPQLNLFENVRLPTQRPQCKYFISFSVLYVAQIVIFGQTKGDLDSKFLKYEFGALFRDHYCRGICVAGGDSRHY